MRAELTLKTVTMSMRFYVSNIFSSYMLNAFVTLLVRLHIHLLLELIV